MEAMHDKYFSACEAQGVRPLSREGRKLLNDMLARATMEPMNTCPDCGGSGFVMLLTSRAPCTHPSHAAQLSDVRPQCGGQTEPLKPGDAVAGPGYFARFCEDKVWTSGGPSRYPSLFYVSGWFETDSSKIGNPFDLSTIMPLIGQALITREDGAAGGKIICEFESTGPVHRKP